MVAIFEIYRPSSLDDAVEFLHKHAPDARPLAGGTELLILIRDKKIKPPKYLVDLSPLRKDLSYVKLENGLVKIGALTTVWELSESFLHRDPRYAGFKDVWHKFGTMHLRFVATIGGNIATATDFSDYIVLLLAYGASVKLRSVDGERVVPLEELIADRRQLAARPDELIVEVLFPEPPPRSSSSFEKFDRRQILIAGIANGCSYLHLDEGGKIADVRISFDMVKGKRIPGRVKPVEDFLRGKVFTEELVTRAAEEVLPRVMEKYTDWWTTAEYRLEMSKVTLKRTLLIAKKRIEGGAL
ncbi:MAG: FAD binding domain-containing protein [Desulfurococcaceae archaeon]